MPTKEQKHAQNQRQLENRRKYNKEKMAHLCTIRLKHTRIAAVRKAKAKLRGLSWVDIIYRGLGLKRG